MSTVAKLKKVIKNDQNYTRSTKYIIFCYLYIWILYVSYSSFNNLTFEYSYWKKCTKCSFEKAFLAVNSYKDARVWVVLRCSEYHFKEKKFTWTASGEAIVVPALAQSRANSEVRSACRRPGLVELWITARWPAPVLSQSLGKFFSPLCSVEICHVSGCVSCTYHFTPHLSELALSP